MLPFQCLLHVACVGFLDFDLEDKNAQPVGKEKNHLKNVESKNTIPKTQLRHRVRSSEISGNSCCDRVLAKGRPVQRTAFSFPEDCSKTVVMNIRIQMQVIFQITPEFIQNFEEIWMHLLQNHPFLGFGINSLFRPVSLGSATHNGHSELVAATPISKVCFCRKAHHQIISQVIHLGIAGTTNCTFYN